MSTGSGGSEDVDRDPALFSSKDFSMATLSWGSTNIWDYRLQPISSNLMSKGITKNNETISIPHLDPNVGVMWPWTVTMTHWSWFFFFFKLSTNTHLEIKSSLSLLSETLQEGKLTDWITQTTRKLLVFFLVLLNVLCHFLIRLLNWIQQKVKDPGDHV